MWRPKTVHQRNESSACMDALLGNYSLGSRPMAFHKSEIAYCQRRFARQFRRTESFSYLYIYQTARTPKVIFPLRNVRASPFILLVFSWHDIYAIFESKKLHLCHSRRTLGEHQKMLYHSSFPLAQGPRQ
jgi:hypothetical protein